MSKIRALYQTTSNYDSLKILKLLEIDHCLYLSDVDDKALDEDEIATYNDVWDDEADIIQGYTDCFTDEAEITPFRLRLIYD
jgi:hypothetical protein